MPSSSSSPPFPTLRRIAQINSFFCGPASLQMLFSFHNIDIDQNDVVTSLNLHDKVRAHGMTLSEMGEFVTRFYPQLQFWSKFNATISDLSMLVNVFQTPVGVEWQGIFDYPDEEVSEDEDDDPGHLAVITAIDTVQNYIQIADPDQHYAGTDRRFSILQFSRRWWDINKVVDPHTGKLQEVDDYQGLFIITTKQDTFPQNLGLIRSDVLL